MSGLRREDWRPVPPEELRTLKVSERDLRAAARLLKLIAAVGPGDQGTFLTRSGRSIWQDRARQMYADRVRRSTIFKNVMFGEAAWDILLVLYATDQTRRHTVSDLVSCSATTPTTGLRWLRFLEEQELVIRKLNPLDRRVIWIELADRARELLDTYFAETPGQEI